MTGVWDSYGLTNIDVMRHVSCPSVGQASKQQLWVGVYIILVMEHIQHVC